MRPPEALQRWWAGWADLARHRDVAGYGGLGRLARLRLDLACLAAGARRPGTWRAALWCLALGLAAQLLCWRLDLRGAPRDLLCCLPVLLVAPGVAAARRGVLEARAPSRAAATGVTDPAGHRRDSAGLDGVGRARWRGRRTTGWQGAGRGAAGSTSSSPSPASARWRRWRCRASRN